MTPEEHQRERMRNWSQVLRHCLYKGGLIDSAAYADQCLAEFDKRFPAPGLDVDMAAEYGRAAAIARKVERAAEDQTP